MDKAERILRILLTNGFEALKVGGYVRDRLLGHIPKDMDIATNATPDQVINLFSNQGFGVNLVGKNFGVVIVDGVEVASYRTEQYMRRGKPNVQIVSDFYQDSSRRDFTINAMALTVDNQLIDYHGGLRDMRSRLVRAVGGPEQRFLEDPSRILRGVELAARLGFKIEADTKQAMTNMGYLLKEVPYPLVGKIVKKAISFRRLASFIRLLEETKLLQYVFPELVHTVGCPQNPRYHKYDVFRHILAVIRAAEKRVDPILMLGALLHDIAKGLPIVRGINRMGQPSDIGHEEAGVPIARAILSRLEFDKSVIRDVLFLVNFHGIRLEPNPKRSTCLRVLRRLAEWYPNKRDLLVAVRRLFVFMNCDAEGFADDFGKEMKATLASIKPVFIDVLKESVLYVSDLPITGRDLVERGYQGKAVGEILRRLVDLNKSSRQEILAYLDRLEVQST